MSFNLIAETTESYDWQNVAIGGGGFVSGVTFSPIEENVIYARTDVGGAYSWDETNQSWVSMMDWVDADERGLLGVESLTIDPNEPGTVYMMAGTSYWNQADDGIGKSAFLRSNDYGETWEKIYVWDNSTKYFNIHGNGMGRGTGERLAVDPANSDVMFYGSRNKGLWKSTDNGSSWDKVSAFPVDTTWNGCGISFVAFDTSTNDGSQTSRIYVGVLRKADNIFVSEDAGESWSLVDGMPQPTYDGTTSMGLMPQRIVIEPDGSAFYITTGNGAGPHTMQWDEGWGDINDWFNRGAVYKYDVDSATWTDISPQNLIDPDDEDYEDPSTYFGNYSGISIDPNNPDHMVVSSIASYRGPQFWLIDGTWEDKWGDNIFVTEDGGETWVPSFQYYWIDGGYEPNAEQMDENGINWITGGTIHWIGCTAIDPYNPERVMVTSGNGVWMTDDIFNYEWTYEDEWGNEDTSYVQSTVWKFAAKGIEEVVPYDVVSIPDGPTVSVIADYDGFVHDDLTQSPDLGRHATTASGYDFNLGTTTGLAYAPLSGKLAKVAETRTVSTEYNDIPIGPIQYSTDGGETWTVETYTEEPPTDLDGGKVALAADGSVALWMPSDGTTMYRHENSAWTEVSGISFSGRPVGDQVNSDLFYTYNQDDGYMYISTDAGESFSQAGYVGTSEFRSAVAVPENEGHIWVPLASDDDSTLSGGLSYSTDGGESFSLLDNVTYCEAVGFGKAATSSTYPTIFIFGEVDDVLGVFRSIDMGTSWVRVNDDDHEYGGLANGEFVVGDMNVFGRVYMSTAGRGIVYGEPEGSTVSVTGVSLTTDSASISIGETVSLTAEVSPEDASNQGVSWTSSDTDIATVSAKGVVTGISAGTVTITVTTTDGGYTASAQVEVTSIAVTGVSLSSSSASLTVGDTAQLSATVSPEDATNTNVSWSSSDESIATVTEDGLVTAVAEGTASIIVTTEDGGYTASATIDVSSIAVTGISVSPVSDSITISGTVQLTATISPEDATNTNVSWSSSNDSIATVTEDGLVTGVTEGSVYIMVTSEDGDFTDTCNIIVSGEAVNNAPVAAISADVTSGTVSLTVTFDASDSYDTDGDDLTYSWDFGDDSSDTVVSPSHTYTTVGSFIATVTVSDGELEDQASVTIEVDSSTTTLCEDPVSITIPYTQEGAGQYCWVTSEEISYVNSWSLDELTINGIDYTNVWSSDLPDAIDGVWYIYYDGPYTWSHFDAASAEDLKSANGSSDFAEIKAYPNPFTESILLNLTNSELVRSITIIDNTGKTVETIDESNISSSIEIGNQLEKGVYIIKIMYKETVETISVIKK